MVITARVDATTQIDSSYSPGGANVHLYLTHGSLTYASLPSKRHLDRFSRFRRVHDRNQHTDRQTTDRQDRRRSRPRLTLRAAMCDNNDNGNE